VDVPPKKIQDKIVETITPIEKKLAAEKSRREALDTLFASLLHDLMTAKIRINTS
jgi:type I restriction enzyme S subunit